MDEKIVKNRIYTQEGTGKFRPGNPGKPKGAISHEQRIRTEILGCWNSKSRKILKWKLKNPETFMEAVRVLLALMVKSETKNEFNFGDRHNTNITNILNSGTKEEQDKLLNSSLERINRLRELVARESHA